MSKKQIKFLTSELKAEAASGKTTIEGWANKAITDSIGDYMIPSGVKLDRFAKNPIMFFNHDRDYPIGKVTQWKADDENGFWVRAEISDSDDPKIKFVRDLINEGILRTFSIGYNERQAERQNDGSRKITDWELHEVSVVSLPMNEASTFSLSKALDAEEFEVAKKILQSAKKSMDGETEEEPKKPEEEITEEQRSAFQECVNQKIPKLIEEGKPQDQAVAIAISMCREDGKCMVEPTDEEWKKFLETAESHQKQASMVPSETEKVNGETPPVENDLMGRLDQLISLVTVAVQRLDQISGAMLPRIETTPDSQNIEVEVEEVEEQQRAADPALAKVKGLFDSIDEKLRSLGL